MSAVSRMRATFGRFTSPSCFDSRVTDIRKRAQNQGVEGFSAAASRSAGRSSFPATLRIASSSWVS